MSTIFRSTRYLLQAIGISLYAMGFQQIKQQLIWRFSYYIDKRHRIPKQATMSFVSVLAPFFFVIWFVAMTGSASAQVSGWAFQDYNAKGAYDVIKTIVVE